VNHNGDKIAEGVFRNGFKWFPFLDVNKESCRVDIKTNID